jgi:hypothetical protein
MEESKTKNIESSLAAFRAIKTFVFMKGAYPRNFDTGFWDESDYEDPDLRRSMRDGYEQHLEMLAFVYNNYVKALYEAIPHVESEYNSLVINSRNMEQAVKLFSDKYEEAIIAVENELDTNRLLRNYLAHLKEHGIITFDEGNDYQELVCRIGILYNDAVHVVCKVFGLERPWNQVMSNAKQIPNNKVEENESSTPNTDFHTEMQESTISTHTDSVVSDPSSKEPKDTGNHTKPMARAIAVHWGDEVRVHTDLANLSVGLAQIRIRLLVISLKSHLKSLKSYLNAIAVSRQCKLCPSFLV